MGAINTLIELIRDSEYILSDPLIILIELMTLIIAIIAQWNPLIRLIRDSEYSILSESRI